MPTRPDLRDITTGVKDALADSDRDALLEMLTFLIKEYVVDLVLTYRSEKRVRQLEAQSGGRVKVVDEKSAYLRLRPEEDDPESIYRLLIAVLGAGR